MRTRLLLALAAGCALVSPAAAATYVLNLTGTVANGSPATVNSGNRFEFFILPLDGFDPLTLAVGDEIQATITLDQALTAPAADIRNGMDIGLLSTLYPGISTSTSGTTQLFLGTDMIVDTGSGTLTSDQFVNAYVNFAGTAFSFDKVLSNFTITDLGAPSLTVDYAYLSTVAVYQGQVEAPAVPEPATWMTMILGMGLVGAALRRRPAPTARIRHA